MKANLSALTLKFKKIELEKQYEHSNQDHQQKFLLLLCLLQAVLITANASLNPTMLKVETRLIFSLTLIPGLIIFYFVLSRYLKAFVEGGICLIIIIFTVVPFNTSQTSDSNYPFYFSNKQLQIFFLLILRVSWRVNVFLVPFLEGFTTFWSSQNDDLHQLRYYPVVTYVLSSVTLLAYNYWGEKQARTIFYEKLIHCQSLEIFKEILNNVIPSGALIIKKKKIIFSNVASQSLFGTKSSLEIEAALNKITVLQNEVSLSNVENINLLADMDFFTTHGAMKTMEDPVGNLNMAMNNCSSRLSLNRFEFFSGFMTQEEVPGEISKKPIDIQMGKIIWDDEEAILLIINDDSAAQRLKYLKALVSYKDKLLSSVSHNLRTPLNGILGTLTLACERIQKKRTDYELSQNAREGVLNLLDVCLKYSALMLYTINDILDYSQITNGKLKIKLGPTNIKALVEEVVRLVSSQAQEKDIRVELLSQIQEGLVMLTDCERLKQILLNLLTNAVKFTREGFIRIEVKQRHNKIKFAVVDTGVGIKPEDLPKIFKIFGKLDQSDRTIEENGVGLGLAVSQNLVKILTRNRGEIRVKSVVGEGSRFSFPLYLDRQNELEGASFFEEKEKGANSFFEIPFTTTHINELEEHISEQVQKYVLIVDDDNINQLVESNYVKSYGLYKIWKAWNGKEALELILKAKREGIHFDAILMDCNMPVMDGYQASLEIKRMEKDGLIPPTKIIAVTANVSESDKERCFENKMDYYMTKPINKAELQSILFKACFN